MMTYEEYKEWLENEKVQLQGMLGKKAWTNTRGDFIWTQEIIDETVAMYEDIPEKIKNGLKVSKTVGGTEGGVLIQGNMGESPVSTSDFDEYKKFGLKWNDDEKKLYYKGRQVRYFFDGADIENGQAIYLEYCDINCEGEIDVYAVRKRIDNDDGSYDLMGPLTALSVYSQKEFDKRVLLSNSSVDAVSYTADDTVLY